MKLLVLFLYLLPLFLSPRHAASPFEDQQCSDPADIERVCRTVTAGMAADQDYYEYCVGTLRSDPKSESTDLHGLATLATRLAIAHATSTESKIEELMELESDPKMKGRYDACLDAYSEAVGRLRDALDNLDSRLYRGGMTLLESAAKGAEGCEGAFEDAKVSPFTAEDGGYRRLANIAYHIAASVE